jgi:hypothetical protein
MIFGARNSSKELKFTSVFRRLRRLEELSRKSNHDNDDRNNQKNNFHTFGGIESKYVSDLLFTLRESVKSEKNDNSNRLAECAEDCVELAGIMGGEWSMIFAA